MSDLIDRQAAIDKIRNLPNAGIHWYVSAEAVFKALIDLPSAQPWQKPGKWIRHHEPFAWMGDTYWTCSECNYGKENENRTRSSFCPNCGANMKYGGDDDRNTTT